jgi:hypothetical protein
VIAHTFAGAWLVAFVYAVTLFVGALFLTMIGNLTSKRWFVGVRRLVEGVLGAAPVIVAAFIPVLLTLRQLYPWVDAPDPRRHVYFSPLFFVARALFYLGTWSLLAALLRRTSLAQDVASPDRAERLASRLRVVSAVGIPITALTMTFAAFDWVMSLDPDWASSIFGVYLFAGALVAAIALTLLLLAVALKRGVLPMEIGASHVQAVGKLLLVFVLFWAYIAFCQLVLIWLGNLPDEVSFYTRRSAGVGGVASLVLALGHFVLPLVALLSWRLKRSATGLVPVAVFILVVHYVDVAWLVVPTLGAERWGASWAYPLCAGLVFGSAALVAILRARKGSPTAAGDPAFPLTLLYEDT